jgi:release factor glutamine methyltransferase
MKSTGRQPPDARVIAAALEDAGVRTLLLRRSFRSPTERPLYRKMQVLVNGVDARRAVTVIDGLAWRYAWVRTGLLRLVPGIACWWDSGHELELYWGLMAAPLPSSALRTLERALWNDATPSRNPDGYLEPDPAALLVHLAVQSCRPGRGRDENWNQFRDVQATVHDLGGAHELARKAGVSRGFRRALAALKTGKAPSVGSVYDGGLDIPWRAFASLQSHARPARLRRLLAGTPSYGDADVRCRVAGMEVEAGAGVFVPAREVELLVEMARKESDSIAGPTIVEVGTGCGVVALAMAQSRLDADVHATDISRSAIRWAEHNAQRLAPGRVRFYRGSLVAPLPLHLRSRVDLLVANLPYVPRSYQHTIGSVPRWTIEGSGEDGLGLQRRLASDARPFLRPGGRMLLQMLASQWELFTPELEALGYRAGQPWQIGAFALCPAERS